MQVTKQLRTETGHRLTNYNGRCSHLHGHSYLWEVTARSHKLDAKNMVMDFKDLKKAMNTVLDPLDHCLVLAPDDPLRESGLDLSHVLIATNGQAPRLVIWNENPTAESFARWAMRSIESELFKLHCDAGNSGPMLYYVSEVRVWETATSCATATAGDPQCK